MAKKYAGFWLRFFAHVIDNFIILPIYWGVGLLTVGIDMFYIDIFAITPIIVMWLVFGVILGVLYFAFMESSKYQGTVGKMAVGIKVTDINGKRISLAKATVRFFGKYLSGLILCIGYLMIAVTDKKQGLHDIIAKTLVVKK